MGRLGNDQLTIDKSGYNSKPTRMNTGGSCLVFVIHLQR
jgi:hypothetical protein